MKILKKTKKNPKKNKKKPLPLCGGVHFINIKF